MPYLLVVESLELNAEDLVSLQVSKEPSIKTFDDFLLGKK